MVEDVMDGWGGGGIHFISVGVCDHAASTIYKIHSYKIDQLSIKLGVPRVCVCVCLKLS